jgi:hypothetical protein
VFHEYASKKNQVLKYRNSKIGIDRANIDESVVTAMADYMSQE